MNGLLVLAATLAMMWLPAGAQARADSLAAAEQTRLDSWMGDLAPRLARTPLNRIAMPGSHDAGSWSITARSGQCRTGYIYDLARTFPQLAASVSRTQRVSIAEQLATGSRYVDLRLCKQDGQWFTYHGAPLGAPFFEPDGEAEQIGRWIAAHPAEIVVVSLSVSAPAAELPAATAEAYDRFAAVAGTARIASRQQFSPTSTYGSLVAAGKNVILLDDSGLADRALAWNATATSSGRGSYPADSPPAGNYLRDFADPRALFAETLARDRAALARDPGEDAGVLRHGRNRPAGHPARPGRLATELHCAARLDDVRLGFLLRPPQRRGVLELSGRIRTERHPRHPRRRLLAAQPRGQYLCGIRAQRSLGVELPLRYLLGPPHGRLPLAGTVLVLPARLPAQRHSRHQ
ncbi:hypothetical protein K7B10_36620 [Streptomyces flavotricini]|uniref:Phosphatidylinositol diacylglycerol-lyase n=1 Tax=Streptomyces flavotricini TaxID=66888 RepID=A0ABS8EGZ6_9ACTN|nr:hypothetical protein [Streptomyces flavotricini]MCC0100208.1 hypothetical protein [Streptomyces flavotricini]